MRDELLIMKLLSTGLVMGILVAGLLLSPFVSGNPIINKVFAQQEEDGPVNRTSFCSYWKYNRLGLESQDEKSVITTTSSI